MALTPSLTRRRSAGLDPDTGQGLGWSDTCRRWNCADARLQPVARRVESGTLVHWTCPRCEASYGALDADERARFAAVAA